jgi:hypothetical protein
MNETNLNARRGFLASFFWGAVLFYGPFPPPLIMPIL